MRHYLWRRFHTHEAREEKRLKRLHKDCVQPPAQLLDNSWSYNLSLQDSIPEARIFRSHA